MELPIEKRIRVVNQLSRLDYSAKWGLFPEYCSNAATACLEVTETLITLFGRKETDKLLVEAGINHER